MTTETTWTADGLTYTEVIRQGYNNDVAFSAGTVTGHPVDTLYFRWQRGDNGGMLLLRPDEVAAIGWCLNGVLWSKLVDEPTND